MGKQLLSHNILGYSLQENQLKILHIPAQQGTESKSEHAEKGDIGDNMRNDTKSPSKVRTSKGCYYTTQQSKMIQQELGIEPQMHLHKPE